MLIKNNKQKDSLAKFFYDLAKIVVAILIIGPVTKLSTVPVFLITIGIIALLLFITIAIILDNKEYNKDE